MRTFCKFTLTPYEGEVWVNVTEIEGIIEYQNHTIISTSHNSYDVKEKASEVIEKLICNEAMERLKEFENEIHSK